MHMSRPSWPMASLIAAVLTPIATVPALAQTKPVPNSYFFGDSDLEQGNYQIIAGLSAAERAPYSCKDGLCRDSNGPIWAEIIAPQVRPALAAGSATSLNFAVSGAHMTQRGDPDLNIDTGVTRQVDQFLALQAAGALKVTPKDRLFIHAGTNDMLRILGGEAPAAVASDIVSAARDHVSVLAEHGARTIVVALVQPVQVLPFIAAPEYADLRDFAAQFVATTNVDLRADMVALRPSLPVGTKLVLLDQPAFFRHLQANYTKLGFTTFTDACYDPATGQLCSGDPNVQNAHVFFDGNHLTSAAHGLLADWYSATLNASDGSAGALAIAMPDAALSAGEAIFRQSDASRRLMSATGAGRFVFGAPFHQSLSLANASGQTMGLDQNGGVIGVQWRTGKRVYASLAGAYLNQRATMGATNTFRMRETAIMGSAGLLLRNGYIGLHASMAAPRISAFQRDVGALGLIATSGDKEIGAKRFDFGLEAGSAQRWGRLTLTTNARLHHTHVHINSFAEKAADGLALNYAHQRLDSWSLGTQARLGWRLVDQPGRLTLMPYASLGNTLRLAGKSHVLTSTLQGGLTDGAVLRQTTLGHDRQELGGGVELGFGRQIKLGLAYTRNFGGGQKAAEHYGITLGMGF